MYSICTIDFLRYTRAALPGNVITAATKESDLSQIMALADTRELMKRKNITTLLSRIALEQDEEMQALVS